MLIAALRFWVGQQQLWIQQLKTLAMQIKVTDKNGKVVSVKGINIE